MNGDDYFERQDLDVAFRINAKEENETNIGLVNRYKVPLIICSSAPSNVVKRTALHERYWFAPLVDDPEATDSITRKIVSATDLPALNTGGTVGTAAWVFAHSILKSLDIALVGVDYSYYEDLPLEQTQEWNMLKNDPSVGDLFPFVDTPYGRCRTSPTYFWYAQNFYSLLEAANATVTNCSGHGIIHGGNVKVVSLEAWLTSPNFTAV